MFNNVFFFFNLAIYEVIWKNFVEPGKPQMTVWCMHIACWISKATNTHSEYVLLNGFSTATVVACTHLIVTVYAHCLACCNFD